MTAPEQRDPVAERDALVARLRAVIEWVSERDQGRAAELDEVAYQLEMHARDSAIQVLGQVVQDASRDRGPRDPVEELRQRLQRAAERLVPTGFDTQGLYEVLDQLDDELSVEHGSSTHPAVQAVARELVRTAELAAYTDEQARPVVQRILDGELGHEAALAMTRVLLDLAHSRGEAKALERAAGELVGTDDTSWPSRSQCGGSGYQPCAPGSPHPAAGSPPGYVLVKLPDPISVLPAGQTCEDGGPWPWDRAEFPGGVAALIHHGGKVDRSVLLSPQLVGASHDKDAEVLAGSILAAAAWPGLVVDTEGGGQS